MRDSITLPLFVQNLTRARNLFKKNGKNTVFSDNNNITLESVAQKPIIHVFSEISD